MEQIIGLAVVRSISRKWLSRFLHSESEFKVPAINPLPCRAEELQGKADYIVFRMVNYCFRTASRWSVLTRTTRESEVSATIASSMLNLSG